MDATTDKTTKIDKNSEAARCLMAELRMAMEYGWRFRDFNPDKDLDDAWRWYKEDSGMNKLDPTV